MYLRSFLGTRFLHVTQPLLVTFLSSLCWCHTSQRSCPSLSFPLQCSSSFCRPFEGWSCWIGSFASGQLNVSLCIWTAWELFLHPASFPLHLNGSLSPTASYRKVGQMPHLTLGCDHYTLCIHYTTKKCNKSTYFSNKDGVTLQLGALKGRQCVKRQYVNIRKPIVFHSNIWLCGWRAS